MAHTVDPCAETAITPVERMIAAALHYLEAVRALPDDQLEEAADCLELVFSLWEAGGN